MKHLIRGICAASLSSFALVAAAQDYPARPVRMVVPYAAGGPTDIIARVVAGKMGETLGQPVVVENRPGGGTLIGTRAVLQAPADGYTMLLHSSSMATNSIAYKAPGYKMDDFTPIAPIASTAFILSVHQSLPVKNLAELVAYAKANPGKLNSVTLGQGTTTQMLHERFRESAGITVTQIPYTGSGPATQALLQGTVQMFLDGAVTQLQQKDSPNIRLIAITTEKRSPLAPNVATFAEQGYPNMVAPVWFALFTRAGSPAAANQRLTTEALKATAQQDVKTRLIGLGLDLWTGKPEEFAKFAKEDLALWEKDIRKAGLQLSE